MAGSVSCPVCGSHVVELFLSRTDVPVHQNLIAPDQATARMVPRGDLQYVYCAECAFVFNEAFDPTLLQYGVAYDNTQTYSPVFSQYVDGLIRHIVAECGVQHCRIVEVGCGKGDFLRKLIAMPGAENTGVGFDPSYDGPTEDLDGRIRFERRFYDSSCADIAADVIICRHVIGHVADPVALLRAVRQALIHTPQARVFFETPNVEWSLLNQVFWDFYYEYCSLFSLGSLRTAFEIAGFAVTQIRPVFEGQYLWLEARPDDRGSPVSRMPGEIPVLARAFSAAESALRQVWTNRLRALTADARVALWGAGAKGVTLANMVDPHQQWITCVADINPAKQGCYIPGTGHAIVSPQQLLASDVHTVILLNPNYRKEVLGVLAASQLDIDLI